MTIRILLIGKESSLFQFIPQVFENQKYESEFVTPEVFNKELPRFADCNLIILHTSTYSEKYFKNFQLIRKFSTDLKIPVIVLVDHSPTLLRYRLVKIGFENYLTLPFDRLDLRLRVRQVLNLHNIIESRVSAETILNNLNFGIIVVEKSLIIRKINDHAKSLLGLDDDHLLGKSLKNVIEQRNIDNILQNAAQSEEDNDRSEIVLLDVYGNRISVGYSVQSFGNNKRQNSGYIITLKDITKIKHLREEMRRMDRLASLGVMASGIAHEIRNPLAGIKAMVQTFQDEFEPDDSKNEYLDRIIRLVNRMDKLLRSLFKYARPPKPNRSFIDIEQLLLDVLSLVRQKMREKNIRFNEIRDPELNSAFVDAGQIHQVLINLLLNSIDAVSENGTISMQIRNFTRDDIDEQHSRIPLSAFDNKDTFIEFQISDDGSGITPADLKQIFNPFFTTKTFGTGLGLSIVYQIVKENAGHIFFDSEVGKGTDCYLYLPSQNNLIL